MQYNMYSLIFACFQTHTIQQALHVMIYHNAMDVITERGARVIVCSKIWKSGDEMRIANAIAIANAAC